MEISGSFTAPLQSFLTDVLVLFCPAFADDCIATAHTKNHCGLRRCQSDSGFAGWIAVSNSSGSSSRFMTPLAIAELIDNSPIPPGPIS